MRIPYKVDMHVIQEKEKELNKKTEQSIPSEGRLSAYVACSLSYKDREES